ncbi:hypothetical protein [Leptospira haakeii]|uniref:Peptidase C39-like domain-containing protein n=1 Tax=Leptospira haakeii TaxID=2023198 RepID=A0ABX4PNB0_9LEPT|nr:hypothetical protein [Leptospira haakeii]PKA17270.1 hypothetical protein CH363_01050 [Leptospira haakeii]PKA20994.1 hypothetical protein CH377_01050 [Leptospira haakeii]
MQKLKDEGVKAFKVWIDKKDAASANWDRSGQHYFLVIWDESRNNYIMMDHNNNDGSYHDMPLSPKDFSKFRKITYFNPKTR